MGNYNPHAPWIVGEEWVPIRDENVTYSPAVNAVELGHGLTTSATRIIQDERFYINTLTPDFPDGQVFMGAVYAQGTEDLSGPIKSVIIPVNNGATTGTATGAVGLNGANVADALYNPTDAKGVTFFTSGITTDGFLSMFFAVNSYSAELTGKRILGVNLLYTAYNIITANTIQLFPLEVNLSNNQGFERQLYGRIIGPANSSLPNTYNRIHFGEVNTFFGVTSGARVNPDVIPWNYAELQRFEATASNRLFVWLHLNNSIFGLDSGSFLLSYAALEVIYCEEQRLTFGGQLYGTDTADQTPIFGANILPMKTLAGAANPSLVTGDYTVTLSSPDIGDRQFFTTDPFVAKAKPYSILNGLRELYGIGTHPGVAILPPSPVDEQILGQVFTKEATHVVPQLSLHTSGGPLTEDQVYGRQAQAPVYGSIYAQTETDDSAITVTASYPWVRYYARRFGNTTQPLKLTNQAVTANSVVITPAEFDALPEILDGWKQVTLRFATAPTYPESGSPDWRWTALGEISGDQWQVLGCSAPALSGIAGNSFNQVPAPQQLDTATYGGTSAVMTWMYPHVTTPTIDNTSDGVLMFAQEMPAVTGVAIQVLSQALTGIGLDCGLTPCGIPSALQYHRLSWPTRQLWNTFASANDSFARTVAAGSWGAADKGGTYNLIGTAADFSVNGTMGLITLSAAGSTRAATVSVGPDFDVQADVTMVSSVSSGTLRGGLMGRLTNGSNFYRAEWRTDTTGEVNSFNILSNIAGVGTTLINLADIPGLVGGPGSTNTIRFMGAGSTLKAKIWRTGSPEPDNWDLEITDTGLTTGNEAGVSALSSPDTGVTIGFSNLLITPPRFFFGAYEIQRQDAIDTDWQTIMLATSPAVTGFSDFEARAGIVSSYRIRGVDVYGFEGIWSSTVTSTVPAPGITIGCPGHVLIFTSNESQNGAYNLAYSSAWEGSVEENFTFPEAGDVAFQKMYGRDFVTAFHPLERGGERFSRTVLVQAAAISAPTLGDFRSLRDMAWASVPYMCVRDEDGNRWFATVLVPSGRVQRSRQLYMAAVDIIETTATPSPVDP